MCLQPPGVTGVTDPATTRRSLNEFHFDWNIDVAFIVRVSQKFADCVASSVTIIASKFIHVHANKFIGELTADVARVGKRMAHYLGSWPKAVVVALANDFVWM